MKKSVIRLCTFFIVSALLASAFTGCSNKEEASVEGLGGAEQTTYPIKTDVKLKYWVKNQNPIGTYTDISQFPWYQEWQKRTGVEIEFVLPTIGQEVQQFNILVASGEIPDIMEYSWQSFAGGATKAIEDGITENLKNLMDYTPNYKKFLSDNPEYDKMLRYDGDNYLGFVSAIEPGHEISMASTSGIIMRKDWLNDLGLTEPTTIEEWHTVLTAFKERKGATAPLCVNMDYLGKAFAGAFNSPFLFFVEDGQVKYGIVEPGFKDFLKTMNQWYTEGLIDKNIASVDNKMTDYSITSGKSGAAFGWIGSAIGTWLKSGQTKDSNFDLVGAPYPTLVKGQKSKFSNTAYPVSHYAAISAKSNYKELAARVLDYGYSKEGHMFFNFGVEGQSYNMVDGYPKYTDLILNNPDGLSIAQAMLLNIRGNNSSPSVQDHRCLDQYYPLQQQKDARKVWSDVDTLDYKIPMITHTAEEETEISKLLGNINTYVDEMYINFVLGREPIENFDNYIAKMKELGVDRVIELKQEALKRYNNR